MRKTEYSRYKAWTILEGFCAKDAAALTKTQRRVVKARNESEAAQVLPNLLEFIYKEAVIGRSRTVLSVPQELVTSLRSLLIDRGFTVRHTRWGEFDVSW
jgi:hypothetical protein